MTFTFENPDDFKASARANYGSTLYINPASKSVAIGPGAIRNLDGFYMGIGDVKMDDSLPLGVCSIKETR